MKKALLTGCLAAVLVLGTSVPGMTQGSIRISEKLTMPMGMAFENVFDDNIFLGNGDNNTTEDKVKDSILHIKPNIGLNYEMPERGNIFVGYDGDWAHYATESDNNWQTHKGIARVNYLAPGGIILGLDNVYADAADPYGDATQFGLGRPQTKRNYNDFKGKFGYNFGGNMKGLLYYNNYFQDYKEEVDKTQNHKDNEVGAGIEYKGLAKTWFFLRYHYGDIDYDGRPDPADPFVPAIVAGLNDSNDADYSYSRINFGLTWEPGSKITGELNLGYQLNSFKNERDLLGQAYEDKDTWIASTVINWQALENTLVYASLIRAFRVTGGFSKEFFEDTGVAVGAQHRFYNKFRAEVLASFSQNEYNLNDRDDDNYELYGGLFYDIKEWCSVGADYRYREKSSNIRSQEFKNSQLGLVANFQF